MQAIIMAAGKGSRLGELTDGLPKSFARIRGRSLIEYNIKLLRKYGINDIIIVTGYREECFRELLGDEPGISLVWNPFYAQVNVLGSFYMGMERLTDDFVYMHADTLCDTDIFRRMLKDGSDIVLPVEYGPCDEEAMKVKKAGGRIAFISKDIPPDEAEGEFIGIARIKSGVIPALKESTAAVLREGNIMSYFEGAVQKLLDGGLYSVQCIPANGRFWAEIDFPEDYNRASERITEDLLNL